MSLSAPSGCIIGGGRSRGQDRASLLGQICAKSPKKRKYLGWGYTVNCELYTVHLGLFTVHCGLYIVNCPLYTVHCTVHYILYKTD